MARFTEQQIREAHSKVKSGADYPQYVQDLKKLGVSKYDYVVENGKNVYNDKEGRSLAIALYPAHRVVADVSSSEKLRQYITIHQKGQTDYPTFCLQAAEAGVERWTSDLETMVCSYYDKNGSVLYAEGIPSV